MISTIITGLAMFIAGVLIGGWYSGFIPGPYIPVGETVGFVIMCLAALATSVGSVMTGLGLVMWATS